jgi:hypothetical protein
MWSDVCAVELHICRPRCHVTELLSESHINITYTDYIMLSGTGRHSK